ncbi:hypothetical protein GOP47_0008523 [Adiantum capillus-veneris]|uniref:Uncharacterized protein n=1 Tax=Adiantum capillus-veneris TaxID=13818 RepID=A0A9D4UZH6_ADICA|nr:hypothetical protein GOP47_0008523 [Adiantum capillus-veneris]
MTANFNFCLLPLVLYGKKNVHETHGSLLCSAHSLLMQSKAMDYQKIKFHRCLTFRTSLSKPQQGIEAMRNGGKLSDSIYLMWKSMRKTFRRLRDKQQAMEPGGWKTMPFVLGNEVCEKLAAIGILFSMILYLTQEFHLEQVAAVNILTVSSGTGYLSPILGGYLADAYLGRFWTLIISSLINLMGMSFLVLTAAISSLRPAPCPLNSSNQTSSECPHATTGQLLFLYLAFTLLAIASGGIKPCAYPFGADQFSQDTREGRKSFQSYSNWYFFGIYLAVLLSATIVVYVQQSISWAMGFGIPAIAMAISITVFVLGAPLYRYEVPAGSPLKLLARVCVAAFHKRKAALPQEMGALFDPLDDDMFRHMGEKYVHTDQLRFLDKAAVIRDGELGEDGKVLRPWWLCSVHQIEQLKLIVRTLPIMIAAMLHSLAVSQQTAFSVLQANTMNRHMFGSFKLPAASTGVFPMLTIMIVLPLYDKVVLPYARRVTQTDRGITFLQRIGMGYALGICAMVLSGIVEARRRRIAVANGLIDKPREVVPMSVFWLVPQLCLMGVGEAFNGVGQAEFFYDQVPESMRSTTGSINSCISGVGVYISAIVLTTVQKASAKHGSVSWLDDNLNKARDHQANVKGRAAM